MTGGFDQPPDLARYGAPVFGLGGPLTPLVRILLIANVGVFVLQSLADHFFGFTEWFGLVPAHVAQGAVWQPVTYMFLHGGVWHLLFNMWALFVFGGDVERRMGSLDFAGLYAACGIGAGLCSLAFAWGTAGPIIGASGAIFGVMLAFAVFNPYRPITLLVFLVLPLTLQARWLVALLAGVQMLFLLEHPGAGYVAHLAGLGIAGIYLRAPDWRESLRRSFHRRRVERQMKIVTTARVTERKLQDEVDDLLDKISKKGMSGLTAEEKKRLYEASDQLRKL